MLPRRTRVFVAIASALSVTASELGTVFCFNTPMALAGLLTIGVIVVYSAIAMARLGPRGGLLVALPSLGCIPVTTIVAFQALQLSLGNPPRTTDLEDFMLFLLLVGGLVAPTIYAIRLDAPPLRTTRTTFLLLFVVAVVIVAQASTLRSVGVPVLAASAGLPIAIGYSGAAWRALKRSEQSAIGVSAHHTGQGWIAFDDGTPPVHRPELAGQPEGPVIVRGLSASAPGYRDRPQSTSALTVVFGTAASIRDEGKTRAASYNAIGVAVLAFSIVPLVPWPFVLAR